MTDDFNLATLTQHEKLALSANLNLSDGHAHYAPSSVHAELLRSIADLFASTEQAAQRNHEENFLSSYFQLALGNGGTSSWTRERTHICYSASAAMEIVGNVLRLANKRRVVILEPTFDNIPSILRRHGLEVVPLDDAVLAADPHIVEKLRPDALMVVAPNNPTGRSFSRQWFEEVAALCRRLGTILIVDYAFRFFDESMRWDQYALFERVGLDYLAIEDLGKIWPTQDMKVGVLTSSASLYAEVDHVHDDFLLNVSPITLQLLTAFVNAAPAEIVLSDIRSISTTNRRELTPLVDRGLIDETILASIGIAWMRLPDGDLMADELCARARAAGVHILPGAPFFFASAERGHRHIRIALMRDRVTVREGCKRLLACF